MYNAPERAPRVVAGASFQYKSYIGSFTLKLKLGYTERASRIRQERIPNQKSIYQTQRSSCAQIIAPVTFKIGIRCICIGRENGRKRKY